MVELCANTMMLRHLPVSFCFRNTAATSTSQSAFMAMQRSFKGIQPSQQKIEAVQYSPQNLLM